MTVVTVGPAIKGTVAHGSQVIRHELRSKFVTLVDDRPKLLVPRVKSECCGVADAGGKNPAGARFAVYFPYDRTVLFHIHAAFADITVRANAYI